MKNAILGGAVFAGVLFAAPSAFAYSAQATCPQFVQRGPYIDAMCLNGVNGLMPAHIDVRDCGPDADIGNNWGRLVCVERNRGWGYGYGYGDGDGDGRRWRHRRHGPNWD
ncbi:MAG: hypothetical protein KGL46_07880 [Hyphomicrobiales bacterium]|nr:hypothetical protein [Hyphomicrobiales bacterium]